MTARAILAAGIAALLAFPGAAKAEPIEEKAVLSGKVKLDPAKGYIFVRSGFRTGFTFLRVPDAQMRAEYQKDWDEAFAKARKKYESEMKSWPLDVEYARKLKRKVPSKPVEPLAATFSIGSIELRDSAGMGPMYVFNKGEGLFTYFNDVKPGTYLYYGPIFADQKGIPTGACYCMGSVKFTVKAGMVTDLGNFLAAAPTPAPPYDIGQQSLREAAAKLAAEGKSNPLAQPPLAFGLPAALKDWPSQQAEFSASGKINNFYGLLITRMPPIAGVLDYRRDTVIDVRTGQDVPNPPIVTQVRIKR